MKASIFDGLKANTYKAFQEYLNNGENDSDKIGRIQRFTANDFFRACALGYKACGYKGADLSPVEQYLMHADGRDEVLTGFGHGLNAGPGINPDDPAAWDDWYFDAQRFGGHPWEVCRGGNSTHVNLYVRNDKQYLEYMVRSGKMTQEEADAHPKGYYFEVAGSAWNRSVEAVNFYVALKKKKLPVVLSDADEILARFKGTDYIGIVPHTVIPSYCDGMFPNSYGKILDFMHVYQEEMDGYGDKIEWLPEEEASLKAKS